MKTALALGLGVGGGALYASEIEPAWLDVAQIELPLPGLDPAFDGYRIVQMSDIHADNVWMTRTRLARIVATVQAQQPDLVVVTGDFLFSDDPPASREPLQALTGLAAPDGVWAVTGNHDHWGDVRLLRTWLPALGVNELRDDWVTLRRGAAVLHLAGLDDLWPTTYSLPPLESHLPRLQGVIAAMPADGPAILLAHEPDFADVSVATRRFAAQLSGHSHGGQVDLPFVGAPVTPPLGRRYPAGLYSVGTMLQYTNRGLGMISPHVRFGCRPELTVFTCRVGRGG